MVRNILDKIHLQKYFFVINAYLLKEIEVSEFETIFLKLRREDSYWLSSSFNNEIGSTMDSIFLDIDQFSPDELYDPDDKYNINEKELKERLKDKISILKAFLKK